MSRKRKWNLNSTITQHYGLISLLSGAIGGLLVMTFWLYKVWVGEALFNWITFFGITFFSILLVTIGYILLRAGYEQKD